MSYESKAENLLPGGPDFTTDHVYAFDRRTGVTTLISQLLNDRAPKHRGFSDSSISNAGTHVSFSCSAENLIEHLFVPQTNAYLSTATP